MKLTIDGKHVTVAFGDLRPLGLSAGFYVHLQLRNDDIGCELSEPIRLGFVAHQEACRCICQV